MMKRRKEDPTKTTLFLVPALGFPNKGLKDNGFINGYSFMKGKVHKDCIFLLFQVPDQSRFGIFLEDNKERFVDEMDFEGDHTVLTCPFPTKFITDQRLFWKGSYSKFSRGYKELFDKKDNSVALSIIRRDRELIELLEEELQVILPEGSEVSAIPKEDYETLDMDKVLELIK